MRGFLSTLVGVSYQSREQTNQLLPTLIRRCEILSCVSNGINGDCGLYCSTLDELRCPHPEGILEASQEEINEDPERYQELLECYNLIKPIKQKAYMLEVSKCQKSNPVSEHSET